MGSIDTCNGATFEMLQMLDGVRRAHDNGVRLNRPDYLDEVAKRISELALLHDRARATLTPDVVQSFVRGRHEILKDFTMPRWLDRQYSTAHEAAIAFVGTYLENDNAGMDPALRLRTFAPEWAYLEFVEGITTEAAAAREAAGRIEGKGAKPVPVNLPKPVAPVESTGLPRPLVWRDVRMRFFDGHTLSVTIGGKTERVMFSEMGFASKSNKMPNVQWGLLVDFANAENATLFKEDYAAKEIESVKQRVKRLRKALCTFFGIDANPIESIEQDRGWRITFSVMPESRM